MHIRFPALIVAIAAFGLGCHTNRPPSRAGLGVVSPPMAPHESTSATGATGATATPVDHRATSAKPATDTAAIPPPSAGTSTPTQSNNPAPAAAPYKPGSEPPAGVGGGPKAETGGAVFGDGHDGNTGTVKGGDGSAPNK